MAKSSGSKKDHLLVGAIDFGTSYSGWAFSFLHEFDQDPTKVSVKHWRSGDHLVTEKAPTCVLISEDGKKLEAFGYDAENRYRDLEANGDYKKYYFFSKFKMALNQKLDKVIDRDVKMRDVRRRSLKAMQVISLTIQYLVKDMLSTVNERLAGSITPSDVHWVISVPAIWTDSAKQFMTESAIKAGISKDKLSIALEPEVAAVYCRYLPVEAKSTSHIATFQAGTKYMVLDAGGGTVDISVQQVDDSGGLFEVHAACGGGWGSVMVNREFDAFLKTIVQTEVFEKFVMQETEDYLDLQRQFEIKKKELAPESESMTTFKLPVSLLKIVKQETAQELGYLINISRYSDKLTLINEKLRVEASIMKGFFTKTVSIILRHIENLMRLDKLKDISAIVMVGGYSDSSMLQRAVKTRFQALNVIVPPDTASIVQKGAVIYGHRPDAIRGRVLRYTYGYECSDVFNPAVHPAANKVETAHGLECNGCFFPYARKNDAVKLGQTPVVRKMRPQFSDENFIDISIYATESKPPVVIDQSLTEIGMLTIELGRNRHSRKKNANRTVSISMRFDKTTIDAQATDDETGKGVTARLEFLG